jgi:hypothetical protein
MQSTSFTQVNRINRLFGGLAFCLAMAAGLGVTVVSAKADSIYLTAMLNRDATPDVLVNPFADSLSTNPVTISDIPNETNVTLMTGADSPATYFDTLAVSINSSGAGTLSQSLQLNPSTSTETLMFNSATLLPGAFGAVTGHPGVAYFFAFEEDTTTFYAKAGDVIGGLVTTTGNVNADLKEFDLGAVPLPGVASSGLVMLIGVAGWGAFRRVRSISVRTA